VRENYNWRPLSTALPTREDFDPFGGDLDAAGAWKEFGGLSLDLAYEHFRSNPLAYQEDFMFMGPAAFLFYFPVIERHLLTFKIETEYEHQALILARAILMQLRNRPRQSDSNLAERVKALTDHVLTHFNHFDVDLDEQNRIAEAWHELSEYLATQNHLSC
jgi:hypothetical protein